MTEDEREHLALLVDTAQRMTQFLSMLGMENTPRRRRHWFAKLKGHGIDTSHWDRSPRRWYTDEALAEAVAGAVSYAGALRRLGVPLSGGSHAYLARRIRAASIDTSHFLGQAHYRGREAPRRRPQELLTLRPPGSFRIRAPQLRAAMLASGVPYHCDFCGCDGNWRGAELRLIVDHVSGDWLDNRIENLRFLCPNCHAQTATWCRRKV